MTTIAARTTPLMLAAAIAIAALPGHAAANDPSKWEFQQFQPKGMYDWGGEGGGFRPPLSERDLDAMAEALTLTPDQREALADLHRSLIDEFKVHWVDHRESAIDGQLEAEAETQSAQFDWAARQAAEVERSAKFRATQETLVESLYGDLRLQLSHEQETRWPIVERDRRRTLSLASSAMFDEEALDLASITRALDLTPEERATLAPILTEYADQLDVLLVERDRIATRLGDEGLAHFRAQQEMQSKMRENPEVGHQLWTDHQAKGASMIPMSLSLYAACEKVRDHNRRFIREITPLIPDRERSPWDRAVSAKRESQMERYMSMSRASMSLRMIEHLQAQIAAMSAWLGDEADGMEYVSIMRSAEPLSAHQQEAVAELRDRHEDEVAAIRARHAPAGADADKHEDNPASLQLSTPAGTVSLRRIDAAEDHNENFYPGMEQPNPEMLKELRALDIRTLRELRDMLTINQRAAICMW
jgi:hypothetical protein